MTTSEAEREQLAEQWARVFYKNRWSFHTAEDEEFKKALEMMRPGIGGKLLTEKSLAGSQLDKQHDRIDEEMHSCLQVCFGRLLI